MVEVEATVQFDKWFGALSPGDNRFYRRAITQAEQLWAASLAKEES
jgi:hypothetical protein